LPNLLQNLFLKFIANNAAQGIACQQRIDHRIATEQAYDRCWSHIRKRHVNWAKRQTLGRTSTMLGGRIAKIRANLRSNQHSRYPKNWFQHRHNSF